tara:strand:- start:1456 stop:2802 length:1347 start_codon:yes stop_codon:yes gene_type:complete
MAKNFTDFQELTGSFTGSGFTDQTGTTITDTTTSMHIVGYDDVAPQGERKFTVESVLLAASAYHVGLENVSNISTEDLLTDTVLTGNTSADDLLIIGNLTVEGDTVQLNTESFATSAFEVENSGTTIAFKVTQTGSNGIARFLDNEDLALDIADGGWVGIGVEGQSSVALTVAGNISATGEIYVGGEVDGRHVYEDGLKLDDIQPHADVTSYMLSSVSTRLGELAQESEYLNITVAKGFDLLEDGDNFKKVPTLSSSDLTYSKQKIVSIEDNADVTGDHSADVILNDVPDGPWTGDVDTTYVKVTSAEHDRLVSIRGVVSGAGSLYNGDVGVDDIDQDDIKNAYHDAYPDFWSSANEIEYRTTVVPQASAAVKNIDGIGSTGGMSDGHANLSHVNITESLTAQNAKLGSTVSVASGGGWAQGLTQDFDIGGTILRFIDGILVDSWDNT